jgi:biotin carboxylase
MKIRKAVLVLFSDPSRKALIDKIDSDTHLLLHRVDPTDSVRKQIESLEKRARNVQLHVGGVVGINDFASAVAVAVNNELGFTAPALHSVYQAQHKALFAQHAAACNPHYPPTRVIQSEADIPEEESWYPVFIKPAAGSLSAYSFLMENPEELKKKYREVASLRRADVRWREELFGHLIKPDDPAFSCFLLQPFLHYPQYTVDGYVFRGRVYLVGVTASVFDQAGHSFERFDFPAYLEESTKRELKQVVERLIARLEYDNSCFNVEFFVTDDGHVILIEFNTRLAFQFVPLFTARYANNYFIEVCRLAWGEEPRLESNSAPQMASSCVLRIYENKEVTSVPDQEEIHKLINEGLAYSVRVLIGPGTQLADYKQDAYSFRYAIFNIVYKDEQEMVMKIREVKKRLRFGFRRGPK